MASPVGEAKAKEAGSGGRLGGTQGTKVNRSPKNQVPICRGVLCSAKGQTGEGCTFKVWPGEKGTGSTGPKENEECTKRTQRPKDAGLWNFRGACRIIPQTKTQEGKARAGASSRGHPRPSSLNLRPGAPTQSFRVGRQIPRDSFKLLDRLERIDTYSNMVTSHQQHSRRVWRYRPERAAEGEADMPRPHQGNAQKGSTAGLREKRERLAV